MKDAKEPTSSTSDHVEGVDEDDLTEFESTLESLIITTSSITVTRLAPPEMVVVIGRVDRAGRSRGGCSGGRFERRRGAGDLEDLPRRECPLRLRDGGFQGVARSAERSPVAGGLASRKAGRTVSRLVRGVETLLKKVLIPRWPFRAIPFLLRFVLVDSFLGVFVVVDVVKLSGPCAVVGPRCRESC